MSSKRLASPVFTALCRHCTLLWAIALAVMPQALAAATPPQQTPPAGAVIYLVTLTNLTEGQPFSPPLVVTHDQTVRLLSVTAPASAALAALAQDGNAAPLTTLLGELAGVTDVVTGTQPVALGATTSFTITGQPGDFLSLAAMLVCTNDGIVGLDSANLPDPGTERTIALGAYDVGREENTEASTDLPDACSELGPVVLAGDPNGNANTGIAATTPSTNTVEHPRITGGADLDATAHGWLEVATVTITGLTGEAAVPLQQAGTLTATTTITGAVTLTGTAPLTDTGVVTVTNPLSVTPTTLGVPTDIMTGELSANILALMEEVPGEEPTADMQAVLDALVALEAPPIAENSARNARQFPTPGNAVTAVLAERGESTAPIAVGAITHRIIPGPSEDGILLRIITPLTDPAVDPASLPIVVYYHGGGWVIAGLDAYETSARALANAAQNIVVMVAYRQSPEIRFPAAAEDAYAAYQWVVENAAAINGDPARVAVAGESAGGNLATIVSLLARDRDYPLPVYQVLIYPVTQLVSTTTPSYETYAEAAPLNRAMMSWFALRYVNSAVDVSDPYASPLLVEDLSGLPPATLLTAEIDPLQSEGVAYAARLNAAGVDVVYQNFAGVTHEFFGMGALLPEAQEAVALAAEGLRSAFGTSAEDELNTTRSLTTTETLTGTESLTDTEALTETEGITDTEGVTDTNAVGGGGANTVAVSLVEWAVEMSSELPAGLTTFAVSNNGIRIHDFIIEGEGIAEKVEDMPAGGSGTLTLDLVPGEYQVYCSVGNHAERGMELTLTVTEE